MATASSSPTDPEVAALIRAHVVATLVSGAVASGLGVLVYLQLSSPGILGDAPWLGVGRLQFAYSMVFLFGWLGNALAFSFYSAFPFLAGVVVRLRVGSLKFGIWNFVITAPPALMVLLGILPPPRILGAWLVLSGPRFPAMAMGFLMISTVLSSTRLFGRQHRSFDVASLMLTVGALGLGAGGFLQSWITEGISSLVIFWACILWSAAMLRSSTTSPIRTAVVSRIGVAFMIFAILTWPAMLYFTETLDASSTPTTASETHGRSVFIREGCASCHGNEDRGGIGPDLSRESGARPADWHFAHLFAPRTVTPLSVMPSYAHLFTGAADQPTQDARDLVAYLESLGRAKELGAPAADAAAVHPAGMNPARARRVGATPSISGTGNQVEGLRLFATYCVGCHGPKGEGDGRAAPALRPKPANLAAHRYTEEQIVNALWNGVAGTAMPAWRDQPLDRLAHLITAVQTLGNVVDMGPADAAQLATGARVYAANCTQCHGEHGGGDGFSAASLAVAPANFQRQQPSLDYALRAIAGGVEGTPMAPWTPRISEQELLAVAHYVRSFYTGGVK